MSPPSLMLLNAEPNHPVLREVWLSNNYGEDFEVASYASEAKLVEVVEKEKIVAEDKTSVRYRLRLAIKPPALVGTRRAFTDILAIQLRNGRVLQLPCHVFYGGPRVPRADVRVRPR